MIAALQSPHNIDGPYISLIVTSSGNITGNWEVFFNDSASAVNEGDNIFPASGNETALRFPIDYDAINLSGNNDVWFGNSQSTDASIEIEIYFSMGDVETYDEPLAQQLGLPIFPNTYVMLAAAVGVGALGGYLIWRTSRKPV